jgi:S-adenosylmethionine:tRNA ribosyltransferase-isomerase
LEHHGIHIEEFMYDLPDDRIAKFPLANRDDSRLLRFTAEGISHTRFSEIGQFIPPCSMMVWNDTRVIQARLTFCKPSGALVEVFLLEPADPADYPMVFNSHGSCAWNCLIGNKKRWRDQSILSASQTSTGQAVTLRAELENHSGKEARVKLSWSPVNFTFHQVVEIFGHTPIPPYLKREPVPEDKMRYQTVYALAEGSVAAPTAGLHFTPGVVENLKQRGVQIDSVTLHVGAGTFIPVKESDIRYHEMHQEMVIIDKKLISKLLNPAGHDLTAVGTTTLRSLESLFWLGTKLLIQPELGANELHVSQWEPYQPNLEPDREEVLRALLRYLDKNGLDTIQFTTRLMIVPGYHFKMVKRLVTNFHQPGSTLLLLVAAFTGNHWKEIYEYAMRNEFRFLSYGDSSLLEVLE